MAILNELARQSFPSYIPSFQAQPPETLSSDWL